MLYNPSSREGGTEGTLKLAGQLVSQWTLGSLAFSQKVTWGMIEENTWLQLVEHTHTHTHTSAHTYTNAGFWLKPVCYTLPWSTAHVCILSFPNPSCWFLRTHCEQQDSPQEAFLKHGRWCARHSGHTFSIICLVVYLALMSSPGW